MTEERTKLEVIAPSVEEAVEKGLNDLGLTRDDVEVEILDEGKRGLFGLSTRQARIALKIKTNMPVPAKLSVDLDEEPQDAPKEETDLTATDEAEEVCIARETINIILEKMNVDALVKARLGEAEDNRVQPVMVDIEGNDLSFLIGRKAETINALQYITSLIVSREIGRWIPLQIDVQHYRRRREEEVRKLARRIAEQVVSTGRKQVLEPMPPNERRIVHLELRDNPDVETESTGEEPRRKVTVRLKG
ncbi:MAG: Jag N-terminal domain-containing protein [Anaerolineaceae bacterium]|nr:Jag N-terminal domain-containing protein [Anaerolineaceae bacterium]